MMAESHEIDNEEFCYICFEGATRRPSGDLEPLVQVCRCPTRVHRRCVARWQLYSAGKREEKSCRFCQGTLPDWKEVLTPRSLPPAVPILSIYYNNICCRIRVRPGPDGMQTFLRQLEVVVGRNVADVNFVFRCRCPDTGAEIFLNGLQAFEAAMHCACVRAAQRSLQQVQQQHVALQERQRRLQQQLPQIQRQREQEEHEEEQQRQQRHPLLQQLQFGHYPSRAHFHRHPSHHPLHQSQQQQQQEQQPMMLQSELRPQGVHQQQPQQSCRLHPRMMHMTEVLSQQPSRTPPPPPREELQGVQILLTSADVETEAAMPPPMNTGLQLVRTSSAPASRVYDSAADAEAAAGSVATILSATAISATVDASYTPNVVRASTVLQSSLELNPSSASSQDTPTALERPAVPVVQISTSAQEEEEMCTALMPSPPWLPAATSLGTDATVQTAISIAVCAMNGGAASTAPVLPSHCHDGALPADMQPARAISLEASAMPSVALVAAGTMQRPLQSECSDAGIDPSLADYRRSPMRPLHPPSACPSAPLKMLDDGFLRGCGSSGVRAPPPLPPHPAELPSRSGPRQVMEVELGAPVTAGDNAGINQVALGAVAATGRRQLSSSTDMQQHEPQSGSLGRCLYGHSGGSRRSHAYGGVGVSDSGKLSTVMVSLRELKSVIARRFSRRKAASS